MTSEYIQSGLHFSLVNILKYQKESVSFILCQKKYEQYTLARRWVVERLLKFV